MDEKFEFNPSLFQKFAFRCKRFYGKLKSLFTIDDLSEMRRIAYVNRKNMNEIDGFRDH